MAAVGGDRVEVRSLVPPGGDPHSHEPSPGDARRVAEATLVFSNGLLLEHRTLRRLIEGNLAEHSTHIALAEVAPGYGGRWRDMEENVELDVLWLGFAVLGTPPGAEDDDIRISLEAVDGPGRFSVYRTGTFGDPEILFGDHSPGDGLILPPAAHTHVNWAFTAPGVYQVTLSAATAGETGPEQVLGTATFTFAVETPMSAPVTLDRGHSDVAVDAATGTMMLRSDEVGVTLAAETVLVVPLEARTRVPHDDRFAFLGPGGSPLWVLPQALLGTHVHGTVDPHLWQDPRNAKAYVEAIADALIEADPAGADAYRQQASAYLARLDDLNDDLRRRLERIPPDRRQLVTTHDAFAYLADAYGLQVVGFVVPNPGQEPSAREVAALGETIERLGVPAVFVEPNLAARASVLRQVAADRGVRVCVLYGDAFDDRVASYVQMMRHNGDELIRCLAGDQP